MKKKVLGIFVCILTVVMLSSSIIGAVMAIGPLKALEVGKNPNVDGSAPMGFVMLDDVGPNNFFWLNGPGVIIFGADAVKGEGRMNNAIIADHDTVVEMQTNPALYENKWIYLSGTNEPQWDAPFDDPDKGSHGMAYWLFLTMFGPVLSAELEQEYADGVFYKMNKVGK